MKATFRIIYFCWSSVVTDDLYVNNDLSSNEVKEKEKTQLTMISARPSISNSSCSLTIGYHPPFSTQ